MYQAVQTFHIGREDGTEELVRAGKVFPDNHPYVARDVTGELFEKLEDDEVAVATVKKGAPSEQSARR